MEKNKLRKILRIAKNTVVIIVAVAAVLMMVFTVISVSVFDRNDRNIFGYKMFIALSDSMSATDFSLNDIVVVRNVDPATLQAGDIITYQSMNPDNMGEIITHKIRRLTTDVSGAPGFITYGTTTDVDDETIVTYGTVLGKYCFRIPKLGEFFLYVKTTPGYVLCILIPFLVLIGFQVLNSVKVFKKYKAEQLEIIESEKTELEAERAESQRLMRELMELKEELARAKKEKDDGEDT